MATSPNYGWLEPDNTDLVKNGALAIRTLGNAIDTTMATMTPKSIVDAKGDLIAASANDTPARLAVGTNGQTIVANSSASTGLAYSNNAPLGGLVNLGTTTLTGASTITISGLSNLSRITILFNGASAGASSYISMRLNGDTNANYGYYGVYNAAGTIANVGTIAATSIPVARQGNNAADVIGAAILLQGTFSAGTLQHTVGSSFSGSGGEAYNWSGFYLATGQITSISVISSVGNFDAGSIIILGA
jgi:hypothetical protein